MQAPATLHSNLVLIGIGNGVALGSGLIVDTHIFWQRKTAALLGERSTFSSESLGCVSVEMVRYQPRSGGYGGYVAWPKSCVIQSELGIGHQI